MNTYMLSPSTPLSFNSPLLPQWIPVAPMEEGTAIMIMVMIIIILLSAGADG